MATTEIDMTAPEIVSHVSQNQGRKIVALLRKASELRPAWYFIHERIRKTKDRAEQNTYRLFNGRHEVIIDTTNGVVTGTVPAAVLALGIFTA